MSPDVDQGADERCTKVSAVTEQPTSDKHIDELRRQYPHVSSGFFDLLEERNQISRELSELHGTIAHLVGWYEGHAERTTNTDLAALCSKLRLAIGLPVNDIKQDPAPAEAAR